MFMNLKPVVTSGVTRFFQRMWSPTWSSQSNVTVSLTTATMTLLSLLLLSSDPVVVVVVVRSRHEDRRQTMTNVFILSEVTRTTTEQQHFCFWSLSFFTHFCTVEQAGHNKLLFLSFIFYHFFLKNVIMFFYKDCKIAQFDISRKTTKQLDCVENVVAA